jgi:asparagine synthase (glutamine-hydrolysing)
MCGILFVNTSLVSQVDKLGSEYAKMGETLQPRGPDGSRTLYDPDEGFYFCFHRLAIINTSDVGMQPFQTENESGDTCTLIASGEIYNAELLRAARNLPTLRSDMEIIQLLMTKDAPVATVCNELDGDFAFVCTIGSKIVAARDPVGVRPLFYGTHNGRVIAFASEAKALSDTTLVEHVHAFPPGQVWTSTSQCFLEYTDMYDPKYTDMYNARDLVESLQQVVEKAIVKRIDHSDRPVAFLCSGGVDSSIVAAVTEKMFPDRELTAFSVSFDNSSMDCVYAEQFLRLTRIKHVAVRITEQQIQDCMEEVVRVCETYDAFTIRAAIPMYLLAKYIAENTDFKVILSGEGADELFMGYNYFDRATGSEAGWETNRLIRQLYSFDLLRADRCFAAHGLEVRVPFLDKFVIRHALAIPGALRQPAKGTQKGVLRDAFAGYECLEKSGVLTRGKEGLSNGVGFNLVPFLLHVTSDSVKDRQDVNAVTLRPEQKVVNEDNRYKSIFDKFYAHRDLVLTRTMPAWSKVPKPSVLIAPVKPTRAMAFR